MHRRVIRRAASLHRPYQRLRLPPRSAMLRGCAQPVLLPLRTHAGERPIMPALQPARGTQDLLPDLARRHRRVSKTARAAAALYGFAEIATPIFEFTEVFARPIGEHTDIVSKEMYT